MRSTHGEGKRKPIVACLLTALAGMLPVGCEAPPNRATIEDLGREPRPFDEDVRVRYRDRLLDQGRDLVPLLVTELDRESAPGNMAAANRVVLYLEVLRHLRAREAREGVERLLVRAEDEDVQLEAVDTLDAIGDQRSCDALRAALLSRHEMVRAEAAKVLGRLWCDDAIPDLIAMLDDPNRAPVVQAAASLARLTENLYGTDAAAWREWWQAERGRRPNQ